MKDDVRRGHETADNPSSTSRGTLSPKHTPRPWTCERQDGEHGEIYFAIHGKNYEFVTNVDESKANARLIAAAPDLLAELEVFLHFCPCGGSGVVYTHADETEVGASPGSSGVPCPDCREARAAIAKAIGAAS